MSCNFFQELFPNLLSWELVVVVEIIVETTDEIVDEVDTVVGFGTLLDLALKHPPADLSRKSLDDFSIMDCMC